MNARSTLRVKFDIAQLVASQKLAFTNYPAICELESKHGVNVGLSLLELECWQDIVTFKERRIYQKFVWGQLSFLSSHGWVTVVYNNR